MALKVGELYASFGIDSSELDKAFSSIDKKCSDLASSMAKVGAGLSLAVTTPLVKIGKDMVQSAIDFESAFAGVIKTTDAEALKAAGMTFDNLSDSIKEMSLVAPQTTEALAGIMEMGGQLGVSVTSLEEFTETIAAMGVATNLTEEAAATMFAQFANITGMSQDDFDRLGSTVVALGNNFATTESAVMDMATNLASVGTNIGLTEAQMLAFATAMSSVGIEADAGGTSFSTFASEMQLAVETGSDALKQYAKVAGMSADEFATAFRDDAGGAIYAFIAGLNDAERNGKSAIAVLDEMGITETRQRNMLLSLANSYEVLGNALVMSGDAWEENIALLQEANTRYATTESQIQIMKNALELIKIDFGDMALPYIKDLTGVVVEATRAFLAMDDATKLTIVKVAALAAAAGPLLVKGSAIVALVGKLGPMLIALASPMGIVAGTLGLFAVAAVDANNEIGKAFTKLSKKVKTSLNSVNSRITASIATVSKRMPALCSSIVEGLQDIIPALMDTAMLAITGFVDTIADNASNVAEIGKTIITNVVDGISRHLSNLIPAAARMVTRLATSVISNIPTFVSAIGNLVSSAVDGIRNTDWGALGKELVTAIGDSASEIVDILVGWFNDAKTAIQNVDWSGVWQSIKDSFNIASDWLKNLILGDAATDSSTWNDVGTKIWGWIRSGISVTGDWLKELVLGASFTPDSRWGDVGSKLWESIKGGFSATGDWIKQLVLDDGYTPDASWGEVGTKIWDAIKRGFSATGDWIKELVLGEDFTADSSWADVGEKIVGKIAEGLSSLDLSNEAMAARIGDMSNIASALAEKIVSGKVDFIAQATTFITRLMQGFNGVSLDGFADIFNLLAGSIIDGIGNGIEAIGDAGAKIIGKIADILGSEGFADFTESLKNVATSLIEKLVEQIPKVANAAADIIGAIAGFFNSAGYEQYLDGVVDFAGAIIDALVEAIPEVGDAANRIVGAIGELLTGDAIPNLLGGLTDIASAIINGIVDAIPGLVDSAKDIVTTIGDTLKKMDWANIGDKLGGFATALLDGIVVAFEALGSSDFAGLITAIGDGIVRAAEGLATTAGTLVGKLVGFLLDPSNLAKIEQVGVQFVAELVKGVIGLGASVIEGAAGVLTNAIVGFFRGIFGIQIDPYVEEMMNQFYDMEFDVPIERFDGLGKALGAALINAMEATLTSTKKLEDAVYSWGVAVESGYSQFMPKYEWLGNESVVNLYRGFLSGMESHTATVEESARAAALLIGLGYGENLIDALGLQQPEVAAALYEMFEDNNFVDLKLLASEFGYEIGDLMGVSIPEGYSMAIVNGTPAIIQKSKELIAAGEAVIAEGWNADELMASLWEHTFQTSFAEIAEWKPELIAVLEGLGIDAGSLLGIALPEGVAEGLRNGKMSVAKAAEEIVNAAVIAQEDVELAITENTEKGRETGEAVAIGQDNAKTTVSDASTGLHDTVTGAFEPLPDELTETTDAAMSGMETSILAGKAPSEAAALQVSDAIVQQFVLNMSESNGRQIGTKWMNAIRNALVAATGTIRSTASNAARGAVSAASAALSSSVGSGIGSNFARGIAAGIRSGSSAISAAAQSAAQSALNAAKSKLGIKSPSTVAEKEVGWMWDAGLAQGILGKMALVERAASDVSESLHSSFLVGDPSRGTVYTSGDTIRQTAKRTADATSDRQSIFESAEAIGYAIAARLIESGALDSDIYMDNEKVGEKVTKPVSQRIAKKTRQTVKGRTAQGVFA